MLRNLEKNIEFSNNKFAFALVPTDAREDYEIRKAKTSAFKNFFKNLPLTVIYNDKDFPMFSNVMAEGEIIK